MPSLQSPPRIFLGLVSWNWFCHKSFQVALISGWLNTSSFQWPSRDEHTAPPISSCFQFHVLNFLECMNTNNITLIAKLMGPTWDPSGADRTQVGPMLVLWTCYLGNQAIFFKSALGHTRLGWITCKAITICNTDTSMILIIKLHQCINIAHLFRLILIVTEASHCLRDITARILVYCQLRRNDACLIT